MRQQSYLNSAKSIIGTYKGDLPLAIYLKRYFAGHKKSGSKDRKQISSLCYHFYRLGKAWPVMSIEEKIITGSFLCEQQQGEFLGFHKPEWNERVTMPLERKMGLTGLRTEDVFPWYDELSNDIDIPSFISSFFVQPDLFIRTRPGHKEAVIKKLQDKGLPFEIRPGECILLPAASKLDTIIDLDREAVVQDQNSQQVLNYLQHPVSGIRYPVSAWDCCAASGGKSILAYDILSGQMDLTVSDIRESILSNLKKRFTAAGIKNYKAVVADLASGGYSVPNDQYSMIICDAPCTGSGTWSRTPEQLYYFNGEMISVYADRQKKITSHVITALKKGGMLIYITCSVFRKENEEIVEFIKEKFHLRLLQMELLKGYDKKADSMFTAVFIKE